MYLGGHERSKSTSCLRVDRCRVSTIGRFRWWSGYTGNWELERSQIHETFVEFGSVSMAIMSSILQPTPTLYIADFEQITTTGNLPGILRETIRGGDLSYPEIWEAAFKSEHELRDRLAEAELPIDIAMKDSSRNIHVRDRRHLAILGVKLKRERSY